MQTPVRNLRAAILCTMTLSVTALPAFAEQAQHERY